MQDLIEALTIFLKYGNPRWPTIATHDMLRVVIDPALVTPADLARLADLSFDPDVAVEGCFYSIRFGSA